MAETILQSYVSGRTKQIQSELDCFHREFIELLALLPGDNAAILDKNSLLINMLQAHSDEITTINSCLLEQHNELERRELLLAAVNFMAAKLIGDADWQQDLHVILSRIGKAAQVDRVYIFQDYSDPCGNLCTRKIEEWTAEDTKNQKGTSPLRTQSYQKAGFERWVKLLKADSPIFGHINTFPLSEQRILKKQHISSLLVMPIRSQEKNWGFIGFDSCRKLKEWATVELDVLRTAAHMLGSAISRQRTRDELQEKDQTYRLIMDASKDGCWIVDDQLQTIEVNAALATMIQRDKGDMKNTSLRDFIHPDFQQEAKRILSGKALPGEEINIQLICAQHTLPATVHVSRLESSNQERSKTFLFLRDQSNHNKQAAMNAALVESNERLHGITNLATDAILLLDSRGQIYFWNPAATRIFGYSVEEVIGQDLHSIFCSDTQYQSFQKRWHLFFSSAALQENSSNIREFEVRHKDGSYVWVEISFSASTHSTEPVIVGVCRDITARRNAQQALEKSEQKYIALTNKFIAVLDAIPDGLMEFNRDRRVTWSNKGARTLFNMGNDIQLSECPCPCLRGNVQNDPDCIVTATFKTREQQQTQIIMEDGRIFDHRSYLICDHEGNIDSVVVAMRDVSQQLRLEATAARTAHLASLGIMAAGVAHEINNPNNFIMLNTPLIGEACHDAIPILDSFYKEHGEFYLGGLPYSEFREKEALLHQGILDGSRRIAAIVSHLKEFASQDKQNSFVPMQVNDLAERSVLLVRSQIRKFTSALQMDLSKQLPSVLGNPGQIEQVIINLLMNAAESLPGSTAAIVLSTSLDTEKTIVLIRVCDEGCGIAPEEINKLTKPFYTSKLESGGTGLGLFISQSLVAQHGGMLEIQSHPGEGTTVTVGLPII